MSDRHECHTNDTNLTQVKNFNFDNDTSKQSFSHCYVYYMTSERVKTQEQFYSKNYLSVKSCFRLKSAPQKLKLSILMAKAISKSFTLDCSYKYPCTFPHSYTQ